MHVRMLEPDINMTIAQLWMLYQRREDAELYVLLGARMIDQSMDYGCNVH
jgi:hypothetical protein